MNNELSHAKLQLVAAGTLSNNFNNQQVESLTLSGPINGTDFITIRSLKELTHLDLSDCKFVGGGKSSEFNDYGVEVKCKARKNELSDYMLCRTEGRKTYNVVLLPQGIRRIGKNALAGQINIKSITIPESVKKIDDNAFSCCCSLESVFLNEGLKQIGNGAFWGLSHLTELEIPSSVIKIGNTAFSLAPIKILRVKNPIPTKLKPSTLKVARNKLFPNFPKKMTTWPFSAKDCTLIVPKGSILRYQKSKGWNQFKNIIEEAEIKICAD